MRIRLMSGDPEEFERRVGAPSSELVFSRTRGKAALFRQCREARGYSPAQMAQHQIVDSACTIRRWEDGEEEIPGPVWMAMQLVLMNRADAVTLYYQVNALVAERRGAVRDTLLADERSS